MTLARRRRSAAGPTSVAKPTKCSSAGLAPSRALPALAGLRVMAVRALYYLVNLDASQMAQIYSLVHPRLSLRSTVIDAVSG